MATRSQAKAAINRWRELGLSQKELARRTDLEAYAISKILCEDSWTMKEDKYERICEAVNAEMATRIAAIPMRVLSFCHSDVALGDEIAEAIIGNVKAALRHHCVGTPVVLPEGIKGSLVELGAEGSGLYLVAVAGNTTNEDKRAFAHELEHLRLELLRSVRQEVKPPRSSY